MKAQNNRKLVVVLAVFVPIIAILVWAILSRVAGGGGGSNADGYVELTQQAKNYYESGEANRAVELFGRAARLNPTDADAHLNLANAHLLAEQPGGAIAAAEEALKLDPNSAAAYFVKGSAHIRLGQFEEAIKALQQSTNLDPSEAAAFYQLGLAHQQQKQWAEAVDAFQAAIALEPEHPVAHYNLSQALIRLERMDEANEELALHREFSAKAPAQPVTPATYERSRHTEVRVPFVLEQPAKDGIPVTFANVTEQAFAPAGGGALYRSPVAIVDVRHDGYSDLFVAEGTNGFRLLMNTNGQFAPLGDALEGIPGAGYRAAIAGDLNRDRYEDVIVLGEAASHVFKFATNGMISEVTPFTRLDGLLAKDGALVDLDFTGNTDLIAVTASNTVEVFRNLGNLLFRNITATSGVPASVTSAQQVMVDDLNGDDLMDLIVARSGDAPLTLVKQRGGPLVVTNLVDGLPSATCVATGDFNNDLRPDLVLAAAGKIDIVFASTGERQTIAAGQSKIEVLHVVDYDNDGWLDLISGGEGIRIWRNVGQSGFTDMTARVGLDKVQENVGSITSADFDFDGDTDLLFGVGEAGLQLWRNDGGNANYQIKLRLVGNRSNPSGLGVRIDVAHAGWRTSRTVKQLPIEIGVGKNEKLNSLTIRWFDMPWNQTDVEVEPTNVVNLVELTIPGGSCPYLYAWDGTRFRFVTDLLGAAPLGLPVAEGKYVDADPEEYVWIGNETMFPPRGSEYVLQITEELREVLYLDEAKLVVVDHPAGTDVYPTDKLLPGKPFPPGELALLKHPQPVQRAVRSDGLDVTDALREVDNQMASPVKMRVPQLRGLAELHSVILDFGPLDAGRPLVLGLTGWLRFGGGMANMSAARDPELPFPFPQLEVETADGKWHRVDVVAGAPAGRTKRMMIDLTGKLPQNSGRLRLSSAFEIHWDQVLLFERVPSARMQITEVHPARTDLHWRGFSVFEDLPDYLPWTPDYNDVRQNPPWRTTPAGWCTRYGAIDELIAKKDNALALLNGGDELTLTFDAASLPAKPEGYIRNFFLFTVGWDKDADFHVRYGDTVEPLPFHGMDDQQYGQEPRPVIDGDWWMQKYNTRWVGPLTLDRTGAKWVNRVDRQ